MTKPSAQESSPKRTAWILVLIIGLVAFGYTAVLFVGGKALQDAPLARPIQRFKRGLENLSRAEPPKSLSRLPPLTGGTALGPTPAPSPVAPRVSPSPSLSPSTAPAKPDDPSIVTFTLEYENDTGVRLTGVKITNRLPSGTTYRAGTAQPGAVFDGTQLVWDIGTLDPGKRGTVSFQVATRLKGRIVNRATITSNEAPASTVESSATV